MAKGDVYYFTTGWTASGVGVTRANYPIKQRYIQTVESTFVKFPGDFALVSNTKYWFPYLLNITAGIDADYIEYTTGDEYGWTDDNPTRPKEIVAPNPNFTNHVGYETGERIVYAGLVYEATIYTFKWSDISSDTTKNPYRSNRIRKWRKISDTADNWTQYWYHPKAKRFYTLPDKEEVQKLPAGDEADQTKWDAFLGDAQDLTLSNFTFAQIRALVKQGETTTTATELIDGQDKKILNQISANTILAGQNVISTRDEQELAKRLAILEAPSRRTTAQTTVIEAPLQKTTEFHVSTVVTAKGDNRTNLPGSGFDQLSITANQPFMRQTVTRFDGSAVPNPIIFIFPYRPNNISYSNIGANYGEIDRVNSSPILDFRNYKLMKISFEFLVGANQDLAQSCDEQLRILRTMAQNPDPVQFFNFDSIFSSRLTPDATTGGSGVLFSIIDMSISSIQRTQSPGQGLQPTGEINRATVSMTIQELPIDSRLGIRFPKLRPTGCVGPCNPAQERDDDETCRKLFTEGGYVPGAYRTRRAPGCADYGQRGLVFQ